MLMAMIFSLGEAMPITHLGEIFITLVHSEEIMFAYGHSVTSPYISRIYKIILNVNVECCFSDQLGGDFIKMILEIIESDNAVEIEDSMVTLILSYNLQFPPKSQSNITLQALSEMESAKIFTEKVMLLINREGECLTI